ncbi:hypothetical protein [Streptomyces radicis]|uniref:Uncharacterized protein n=1 Tax=Streptomyces radicis TaxID=1750517 RepID=A0A3A9WCT0_9ACTN|nr:hypothetical protein [Streptomyces radicis]RKN10898.1 hypothetical protein D7319_07055 [Streptomyces radicis]RKN25161.1 hypothetical protein D7318_07910 [Streptomyces radicis]
MRGTRTGTAGTGTAGTGTGGTGTGGTGTGAAGLRRRAREAGFGAVRAVYRERRDGGAFFVWLLVGLVVALPAGLAAWSGWLGLVLSVAVLLPPGLWVLLGPVPGPSGRRWYAVCEGGVVVRSRGQGYVALSWEELREGGGTREVFPEAGARALESALRRGRPVRFALLRQAAVVAAVGAWLAAVVAVVVAPWGADLLRGEQPPSALRDLAPVCADDGRHGAAAPYEPQGPHPVALFGDGGLARLATAGPDLPAPAPEDVQVVACVRASERGSPEPVSVCPYVGGHSVSYFPATHRVEVVEARTGRSLGSFTLRAVDAPTCSTSEVFAEDAPHRERDLTPSDEQFEAALAEYVTGSAD